MPYDYNTERANLFTDAGQRQFLRVRDRVRDLLAKSGAVRMQEAISGETGSSWTMHASMDRLVELGEVREIPQDDPPGQDRIFVASGG